VKTIVPTKLLQSLKVFDPLAIEVNFIAVLPSQPLHLLHHTSLGAVTLI